MTTAPNAANIVDLGRSYFAAKTLLTAVELGLFTLLAQGPATEPEIRERLDLHPRATPDFLDALVGLGILDREGDRYRNSAAVDQYLDPRKPTFRGGQLHMLNWQYLVWGKLIDLLRTGEKQKGAKDFSQLYANPDGVRRFMSAMDASNAAVGPALAEKVDWSTRKSFIDIGGARGNLAAAIVKAHAHLQGGTFDLAPVEPFFNEHISGLGLEGRVTFHAGDFWADPLPTADALVFGHVLHDWDDEQRTTLMRKAYEALPEGGCVMVYDAMIDDDRRHPTNLLLSLNMQLVTPGGSEYTAAACRGWMESVGFSRTETVRLTDSDSVVIGYKGAA